MKSVVPLLLLMSLIVLGGCSTSTPSSRYAIAQDRAPEHDIDARHIPDAVPKREPRSRHGNPASYVVLGKRYHVMASANGFVERGIASWYGKKFHGHSTSSGEPFNMYAMTAAHTRLPLPTYVRVTNLKNHLSVVVRVNDRGPFHANRIIDLSYAAAKKLGITAAGIGMVEIRAIDAANPGTSPPVSSGNKPVRHRSTVAESEINLYLQLGAFASQQNAQSLQARLQRQFHTLKVSAAYHPAQRLYRVRIGPLSSVAEADRLSQSLAEHGYPQSHVVLD